MKLIEDCKIIDVNVMPFAETCKILWDYVTTEFKWVYSAETGERILRITRVPSDEDVGTDYFYLYSLVPETLVKV